VLGLEDSASRMARIGKALLVDGHVPGSTTSCSASGPSPSTTWPGSSSGCSAAASGPWP
jgi:hypothetical protein